MADWIEQLEAGELPPDFELTEDLVKKMGVARSRSAAVLAALQVCGVETWGLLLAIKSEAKLTEYVDNELVGSALWNYLEGYRNKGKSAGTAELKELEKVDYSSGNSDDTISAFFAKELGAKRHRFDTIEQREGAVVTFASHLFEDRHAPTAVFIRKCYREEAKRVHDLMQTMQEKSDLKTRRSVFIGGTRGVGKSIFGALMAFEFVDLGYAVVYEHKNARMLLIGNSLRPEQRQTLERLFGQYGYQQVHNEPGVYLFVEKDVTLFGKLTLSNDLIHVQDLGDGSPDVGLITDGQTRRLLLSSPRDSRLSKLSKLRSKMETIIMPLWPLKELLQARTQCFPHLSETEVKERFEKYGGVARHVLEDTKEKAEEEYSNQLQRLEFSMVERMMQAAVYESLPSLQNMGFLIHVVPGITTKFRCVFASRQAFRDVLARFQELNAMNVKRIATLLQINNELGNIYGILLEETAHYYLSRGEYTYPVHELIAKPSKRIDTSKGPTTHKVTWPKCEETVFFEHVSRIEKIEFGKYYRPRSKIYETIDSFVMLEDVSFLDSELKGPALVLIQVTVSKTHTVNGAKVKELQTDVSAKLGRAQPLQCIFLFATRKYPHGVHTFQTPKKADSAEYQPGYGPKLVEYSLALERDFDEIWRDVEHEHFA